MKKPSSTFWIRLSNIVGSLTIGDFYYLVNKDNGRYRVVKGTIIDTKTAIARRITLEQETKPVKKTKTIIISLAIEVITQSATNK